MLNLDLSTLIGTQVEVLEKIILQNTGVYMGNSIWLSDLSLARKHHHVVFADQWPLYNLTSTF